MARVLTALVLTAALAGGEPLYAAQALEQADIWRAFAEKLAPGTEIRVRLKDKTRIDGAVVHASGDLLRVTPQTPTTVAARDVPFTDIAAIEVRDDSRARRDARLAGVLGAVAGYIAGLGILLAYAYTSK